MDAVIYVHLTERQFYHKFSKGRYGYNIDIGESHTNHATFFVTLDQARQIIRGLAGQLRGIERGLEDAAKTTI